MSEKEKELLSIAIGVISMNESIGAKLSGSLMLSFMGINKRRKSCDIDIICSELYEYGEGSPVVPKEFKRVSVDGSKSDVSAIQFINKDGLKIEFMYSEEEGILFNDVPCGNIEYLIEAKERYASMDKNEESKEKHTLDLKYLYENNDLKIKL